MGPQGDPPPVTKRSERSHTAFALVTDAYAEARAALSRDVDDLTARLDAAKAIAL